MLFSNLWLYFSWIETDGLVGVVDIAERNKQNMPVEAVFNATGDSLLITDSRKQVTLLQI